MQVENIKGNNYEVFFPEEMARDQYALLFTGEKKLSSCKSTTLIDVV